MAREAGVSLTTVTHALNPPPGVRMSPETRDRIRHIARRMGYRPSFVGRALVSGRSYAVGLLQPARHSVYFPLYQAVMVGLAGAMEPEDYHLLSLFRSPERRYLRVIDQGRVDGLFILQSDREDAHILAALGTGIPTVVVNRAFAPPPGSCCACVHSDHAGFVREALADLVRLGCRSILLVVDPAAADANQHVHDRFLESVTAPPAHAAGSVLSPASPDFAGTLRDGFSRPALPWDGIITDGVAVAERIIEIAAAAGRAPGRDFRLVTSDILPGLATRRHSEDAAFTQQPEAMGRAAWTLMQQLMAGDRPSTAVAIPYQRTPAPPPASAALSTPGLSRNLAQETAP